MQVDERRTIGRSNFALPRFGLGTNPLGGIHDAISAETAAATVERCWDLGVRFYDTAPVYGYGNAERAVGEVLRDKPREEFVLTTKVGRLLLSDGPPEHEDTMVLWEGERLYKGVDANVRPYFDFSYDGVMRSLEASRERTGIDRFDLVHIHDPDLYPDEAIDGAFRALAELREQGVISGVGCGMNQWELLADLATRADFDCFLLAGRYTLLDHSALDTLLPVCAQRGISIINGGVYNSGLLSHPDPGSIGEVDRSAAGITSWADNVTYNYVPAEREVIDRAAALHAVCQSFDVPLRAVALQFSLHHEVVASVLMGPRSPEQAEDNVAMLTTPVPAALYAELKERGLLPAQAPTP